MTSSWVMRDGINATGLPSLPSVDMDMMTARTMHFWSSTALASLFIVFGITGNIMSVIVWSRTTMRSSTGTYLIGQALADTGLLLFFLLTDSVPMMFPSVPTIHGFALFYCYVGFPLFYWFILTSIWITVGVTVDRYILVCWISSAKRMCSRTRAVSTMCTIAGVCLLVDIPHFFTYRPVSPDESNITGYTTTEYGSGEGSRLYEFWVHCMIMVLGPWTIIFILNVRIILEVGRARRRIAENQSKSVSSKRQKSELQMTHLLLTVTFTFLVLLAFQCITQCFFMLEKGNTHIVSEAFSIAKLGVVINSSLNFVLYCWSGRKFRRELLLVFSTCLHTVRRQRLSTADSSYMSSAFESGRRVSTSLEGKEKPDMNTSFIIESGRRVSTSLEGKEEPDMNTNIIESGRRVSTSLEGKEKPDMNTSFIMESGRRVSTSLDGKEKPDTNVTIIEGELSSSDDDVFTHL